MDNRDIFTENGNGAEVTRENTDTMAGQPRAERETEAQEARFGDATWHSVQEEPQARKRRMSFGKVMLTLLAVVLVAGLSMGMGYMGARMAGNVNQVVINQVQGSGTSTDTIGALTTGLTSEQVAAKVEPSVVAITTENITMGNSWFGSYVTGGAGSGIVISEDGYILTCAHVVSGASTISVELYDGQEYAAELVGSYVDGDIAVIKIDATGLTPIEFADSDELNQGAVCYAVGNPEGQYSGSISQGIVSALNRTITVSVETTTEQGGSNQMYGFGSYSSTKNIELNVIQMTAAVSRGNSGGALIDANGNLIGVVSAKSGDEDSEGLGFAIPSNDALEIATELIATGTYADGESDAQTSSNRAVLGITVATFDSAAAAQYGLSSEGVYITAITLESAQRAGLQVADRIISVDDVLVTDTADVTDYLAQKNVGDTVTVNVERGGRLIAVVVTLVENTSN
ncbi:MAG: trypsin-like peptidase domain-containing protein [Clostridia bacterium]|nr:trypsin-like peptidase domain-containing protein [Clostridia bacterium]